MDRVPPDDILAALRTGFEPNRDLDTQIAFLRGWQRRVIGGNAYWRRIKQRLPDRHPDNTGWVHAAVSNWPPLFTSSQDAVTAVIPLGLMWEVCRAAGGYRSTVYPAGTHPCDRDWEIAIDPHDDRSGAARALCMALIAHLISRRDGRKQSAGGMLYA